MREFAYRGVKASAHGIIVEQLPPIVLPALRDKPITVPGRHGALHETDECYEEIVLTVDCAIKNLSKIDAIRKWLAGPDVGWLQLDTLPGRAYKARMVNQVDFTRILKVLDVHRFPVVFRCFPLRYHYPEQPTISLSASGMGIVNPGTAPSEPLVTIYGSGDVIVMIGQTIINITGLSTAITLDSEIQEAYRSYMLLNRQMSGDFPILPPGPTTVSWSGNVTRIDIQPRWRDV